MSGHLRWNWRLLQLAVSPYLSLLFLLVLILLSGTFSDEVFDRIVMNAQGAMFDSRAYYLPNFKLIMHTFCTYLVFPVPGAYYVATFGEPLLLTWVGLKQRLNERSID